MLSRGGSGTRSWINIRNHIDGQGVEFMINLYSPLVQRIETIKLEKRIDDDLTYLRDAPPKYTTFPQDMEPEVRSLQPKLFNSGPRFQVKRKF